MTRKIACVFIFVSISFFFCNTAFAQSASENGEPSSADAAAQAQIEGRRHVDWTGVFALAAAGAGLLVHEAGFLDNLGREAPAIRVDRLHLAVG